MFNEITTFGTPAFVFIVFLNLIAIILMAYATKPFIKAGKTFNPRLYGTLGLTLQYGLSIATAFVPWLNIFNLVGLVGAAVVYQWIASRNPDVVDAIVKAVD